MFVEVKKCVRVSFMFTLFVNSTFAVEIKSATEAVNISGKQRMFTQRMLKDYAMVGMNNTFGKPDIDLKNTLKEFDDHMESLLKYTKNGEIKQNLEKSKSLWVILKKTLDEKPSKEKVEKLQQDLDKLLKASDDITKLFAKSSREASGKIVNTAGRQRMLSQRMASLYMLKVWGVDDPQFKDKLDTSMKLFKESLVELENSSLNTEEITILLSKVKRSFMFFEMMGKSNSKFVPTLIYKKSNDILQNMNSATQAYVSLEKK